MDWGDVPAWSAFAISVGALALGVRARHDSRRSADAAEGSLLESRRSADAAEQSVIESRRASDAAARSAEAADQAVLEAARARIDDQVARVTVESEDPQWPPLINPHLSAAGQTQLFDSMTLHASPQVGQEDLVFPERADQLMWFTTHGIVTNEGRSTTRIRIMGDGEFFEGESHLLPGELIPRPRLRS
jgi:hypothetical protein